MSNAPRILLADKAPVRWYVRTPPHISEGTNHTSAPEGLEIPCVHCLNDLESPLIVDPSGCTSTSRKFRLIPISRGVVLT